MVLRLYHVGCLTVDCMSLSSSSCFSLMFSRSKGLSEPCLQGDLDNIDRRCHYEDSDQSDGDNADLYQCLGDVS